MKLKDFSPKSVEFQTRFFGSHLPFGRVWKFAGNIKKLGTVIGTVFYEYSKILYAMITGFLMETEDEEMIKSWESSLGISGTGTNEERINTIKAQIRKKIVVKTTEWSEVISQAVGRTVLVYPARDIDMTDIFFLFPYTFPIYFYPPNPSEVKQSRFIVMVDYVTSSEKPSVEKIVKKFIPSNVSVIYIDRS